VPLALGLGTAAVIGIYMLMNALYLFAMPIGEFAALPLDGGLTAHVAERLFGFVAGNVIAIFTIVSIAALISAMVMAGPRVYYAMARDHVFLKSAARVHPKYRTPVLAITAQAVWSSVLVLSGTLADLVTYTGFAVVLFAGVAVLSLFVLRHREPAVERPFKAWGYPIAPGFFVLASAVMVVYEVVNKPGPTLAGVAIIAVGIPVYFVFARRARNRRSN
jgi:APA family basic amino acid/polyamine antiporter